MNNKMIAFIISVNNELYFEECCWYINRLELPEGFEIDIISVKEAKSMAEAYNTAMESSNAKYKVYIHQDVFIINNKFISDIVNIFLSDDKVGMLGVIGGVKLPKSGIIYNAWNCGRTITSGYSLAIDTELYQDKPYLPVEALDGMLLATQYDIRWREDLFKQWDYYDISQSFEFLKAGHHIVVPYQDTPWTYHDCGYSNLVNYDKNRKIMFEAYPECFCGKWEEYPLEFSYELQSLTKQLYDKIENLINQGRPKEAELILNSFDENGMVKNMPILRQVFMTAQMEKKIGNGLTLLEHGLLTSELIDRNTVVKFFLRRLEFEEKIDIEYVFNWINKNGISPVEIIINIIHNLVDRKHVYEVITKAYRLGCDEKNADIMEVMIEKIAKLNLGITEMEEEFIAKRRIEASNWLKNK